MSHDGVIGSPNSPRHPHNRQPRHRRHALLHLDAHQHTPLRSAHHVTGSRAVAAENEILYDGPADQLDAKYKTLKASIEVRPAGGKPLYTAALGAASSGEHTPAG